MGLRKPLAGVVTVSGAKNSALKLLVASPLIRKRVVLSNVPRNGDVLTMARMLASIGAEVDFKGNKLELKWNAPPLHEVAGNVGSIRSSVLFLGSLLARLGRASVPLPGGCDLGSRKFGLHLQVLKEFGAKWRFDRGRIIASATQLRGCDVTFPIRTTGGTENAMLAGVSAIGRTKITNANTKPEVRDLATFLNSAGAQVEVAGSGLIEIEGRRKLNRNAAYSVMPDELEAFTFAIFAAISGGSVGIKGFRADHLEIPCAILRDCGVRIQTRGDTAIVSRKGRLTAFEITTGNYPNVLSDMQPLLAVLATQAEGVSTIRDVCYPRRFHYVRQLRKMGADISLRGNALLVRGPVQLRGADLKAHDIRCGAAMLAAGLVASGRTRIDGFEQIERGYEDICKKLGDLGVEIGDAAW